ncbi:MAG: MFS transporter, partial [Elusimicrobiota bacterium]
MPLSTDKKTLWGWVFYDFANSPFSTTITTVIFNVYFAQVVAKGAPVYGDTLWACLIAVSTLASGVIAPVLGAVADLKSWKKPLLGVFALSGAMSTFLLVFSGPGTIVLSSGLFFIASISFACSFGLYNAFLNEISTPATIGRISGLGWALGYAGGGLCLALNLWMIKTPMIFGMALPGDLPVRLSFAVVGLWWAIFKRFGIADMG